MSRRAVLTGLGTVGAFRAGSEELRGCLRRGALPLAEVDRSGGYHLEDSARTAALLPPKTLDPWLALREARRMSPPSRMAVATARIALEEAQLAREEVAGRRAGVSLGTAFGCTSYTSRLLDQIAEQGPEAASPVLFTETVANVHAGQVALDLGCSGPSYTITQREASALLALGRGAALVESGRCDVVLAGVVDEMAPVLHAVLDRFRALARATEGDGAPRPFAAERTGVLAAEGATTVVLEEEEAARGRGAPLLARVRAVVRASDPTAPTSDWGCGHAGLARACVAGLERADVALETINLVVSGASGSRAGDRLEAATLEAIFRGRQLPPLVAPKAVVGEYGGNFLAAAVLALAETEDWPRARFAWTRHGPRPSDEAPAAPPGRVLVTSLAAGGAAAWTVLERVEPCSSRL